MAENIETTEPKSKKRTKRNEKPAAPRKKRDLFAERTYAPRVGCIVLAAVAVVLFVTAYIRLSGTWSCEATRDYIRLALVCGLCSGLTMVLLETYIYFEKRQLLTVPKKLYAVATLIILSAVLTAVTTLVSFAFTAAFIAIILSGLLVSKRTAYTMALLMAGVTMLLTTTGAGPGVLDKPFAAGIAILFGGMVSVLMLNGRSGRIKPILSGAAGGAAAAITVFGVQAFSGEPIKSLLTSAAWMFAGCVLSGIIATGLLPLFENIFDVVTDARLNELMNNNNPLLKRLMLEAPGTYHHSLIVAVLADAAAELVGANALLCKTAAYYHDVGKLTSPRYFKENQGDYNIHDELPPEESARSIIAHPKDSATLLAKNKFPSEIVRMAGQHHGDSVMYYFYTKAQSLAEDPSTVDINDFRYDGSKPRTKEDAILMLADCCEAAVRALKRPTPAMIEERVQKIIAGLWQPEDGQLSECPLTARDIHLIRESFIKNLLAQYHERIEYPENAQHFAKPQQESLPAAEPIAAPAAQGEMEPVPANNVE